MSNIKRRDVHFEFEILDTYQAGMALTGAQVKTIRKHSDTCNISNAYCLFSEGELFIRNAQINQLNTDIKCLLNKHELRKMYKNVRENGFTIIPSRIYLNDRGLFKITIHVCRGKKLYDKRQSIKKRDIERKLQRIK